MSPLSHSGTLAISVDSPGLFIDVADLFVVRNIAEKLRKRHEPADFVSIRNCLTIFAKLNIPRRRGKFTFKIVVIG
jgi:hypothetical protein